MYHFGHGEHLATLVPERLEDNATLVVALVLWCVHVCVSASSEWKPVDTAGAGGEMACQIDAEYERDI